MRRVMVASVLLLAACGGGGGDGDVLADAEEHLAGLTEAAIDLELSASTEGSGPVGFRLAGSFSFESDGELPVLDLTYTRLLGGDEESVEVVSDGTTVTVDGVEVPERQVGTLRLGKGEVAGLEELDLADWVEDPRAEEDGATTTVTGELDGAAVLRDLNRISAEVAGAEGIAELDDDAAARLEERITESSIEVVTEGDDHRFRSLEAVLDFGTEVPEGLEDALGPYAAPRLELRLRLG